MSLTPNTFRLPNVKDFTSCVFGFKDEYAILDGFVIIKLPSMKPVAFRYPLKSAISIPGFLVVLFNKDVGLELGIFCPLDWTCVATKTIRGLSLDTVSPSGRYVIVKSYTTSSDSYRVRDTNQLVDIYGISRVKLWMLLSSLLRAKSPLLTKGCYHPIVFSFIIAFLIRV